jgi:hypothetical protein
MLDMDRVLEPYIGDTEAVFGFLTQSWGWIITVEENGRVVYADENKDACVCPMKEGFGERGDLRNLAFVPKDSPSGCLRAYTAGRCARV